MALKGQRVVYSTFKDRNGDRWKDILACAGNIYEGGTIALQYSFDYVYPKIFVKVPSKEGKFEEGLYGKVEEGYTPMVNMGDVLNQIKEEVRSTASWEFKNGFDNNANIGLQITVTKYWDLVFYGETDKGERMSGGYLKVRHIKPTLRVETLEDLIIQGKDGNISSQIVGNRTQPIGEWCIRNIGLL